MFSKEIQKKLTSHGYELMDEDNNIWTKDNGDDSVTISGEDKLIEAIWQNFDGKFEEKISSNIDEVIEWSKNYL